MKLLRFGTGVLVGIIIGMFIVVWVILREVTDDNFMG